MKTDTNKGEAGYIIYLAIGFIVLSTVLVASVGERLSVVFVSEVREEHEQELLAEADGAAQRGFNVLLTAAANIVIPPIDETETPPDPETEKSPGPGTEKPPDPRTETPPDPVTEIPPDSEEELPTGPTTIVLPEDATDRHLQTDRTLCLADKVPDPSAFVSSRRRVRGRLITRYFIREDEDTYKVIGCAIRRGKSRQTMGEWRFSYPVFSLQRLRQY